MGYGSDGKLTFASKPVPNPESHILWDASRDAPPGFGLEVAGKKTYILRRKVLGKSRDPFIAKAAAPMPKAPTKCASTRRSI